MQLGNVAFGTAKNAIAAKFLLNGTMGDMLYSADSIYHDQETTLGGHMGAFIISGGTAALESWYLHDYKLISNSSPGMITKNAGYVNSEGGLKSINNLDDLLSNPSKLSGVSGEELYNYLVKNGYDIKPLSKGSFKGISFAEGGGFKVNWGGDRILQYHPASLSHHGGAYFKISSGNTGTIRIDLDGNIIK